LQIVEIGAIEEVEERAPEWAAEAAEQPLVPAQLFPGVPKHWLMELSKHSTYLRLKAEPHKTFMDQIGQPFYGDADVL
jgi:hypothetical protein